MTERWMCKPSFASFDKSCLIHNENSLRRKNKATVVFKTRHFDEIDLAVIISSISKAVQN